MNCRHCKTKLEFELIDLGVTSPSNAYVKHDDIEKKQNVYPLKVKVCDKCWLVQTEDFVKEAEMFNSDYAYFSSMSSSWLNHALNYYKMIKKKRSLTEKSFVVEIASNDGYLLKN